MTTTLTITPTPQALAESGPDPATYYVAADPANQLHPDPSRRIDVTFTSQGSRIAGHLYRPPGLPDTERTPAVALCGPISSVKEQTVPHYARLLADAGYTALTFDPRHFGESDGEPRFRYHPDLVIEDYANAVNHLMSRDDVDPDRVGVVGVCMGGGYALSVGAREKRLRAVVSVAGGYDLGATFQQFLGVDGFAAYLRLANERVQQQYESGEVAYIPTTAPALSAEAPLVAMPNPEAHSYYERTNGSDAPNWSPLMTADSLPAYFRYTAIADAALVAPTPLLIVHGTRDSALLPEHAQRAYAAATGPKQLVWIDTHNHIELYDQEPYVSTAVAAVVRFLAEHLGGQRHGV